jgi:3-methyladenine DNA glycosylase AlkD
MSEVDELKKDLRAKGTSARAQTSAWFFKTGPGQYGEGDIFIGVTVPEQHKIARQYRDLSLDNFEKLLRSPEHEFRLTALFILVDRYRRGDSKIQKECFDIYLRNTTWINSWDLVDASASYIVGHFLETKSKAVLRKLAKSPSLWERRVAIVATYHFIKQGQFEDALRIAEILLHDTHDLIHKAVGWMLREIGNRSLVAEEQFLQVHAATMPRTMLRYAIEKFPYEKRMMYLWRAKKDGIKKAVYTK